MHRPGADDLVATGKGRRGRSLLEFSFEYGVWSAGNAKHPGKSDNRSGGRIHVARALSLAAIHYRHEFGSPIGTS